MKEHHLRQPDGAKRSRQRRGRGIAAGQGKTGGYGTKGQNARAGRGGKPYFEGGQLPLVRRLPLKRGFNSLNRIEYYVVNVCDLGGFPADSVVDPNLLIASGLVRDDKQPVKILGEGKIGVALTVRANAFSASALAKIQEAGGVCETI